MYTIEVPRSKGREVVEIDGVEYEIVPLSDTFAETPSEQKRFLGFKTINTPTFELRLRYSGNNDAQNSDVVYLTHAALLSKGIDVNEGVNIEVYINNRFNNTTVSTVFVNGSLAFNFTSQHSINERYRVLFSNVPVRDVYFGRGSSSTPNPIPLGNWSVKKLLFVDKEGSPVSASQIDEGFKVTETTAALAHVDVSLLTEDQEIKSIVLDAKARMNRRSPRNSTGSVVPVINLPGTATPTPQELIGVTTQRTVRQDVYATDANPISKEDLAEYDIGFNVQINNE